MCHPLLSLDESIELADEAADVWQRIGRFDDMSWHPAIARLEMLDRMPIKAGARRLLTTGDDAQLLEVLVSYSDAERTYHYRIKTSPLPLTDYDSTIAVETLAKGGCLVRWCCTFRNPVGTGLDDDAVRAIVSGIYRAGLNALVVTP